MFIQFQKLTLAASILAVVLSGCTWLPTSGPTLKQINNANQLQANHEKPMQVRLVDVDDNTIRSIATNHKTTNLRATFSDTFVTNSTVNMGDTLSVKLWESPPSVLFGSNNSNGFSSASELAIPNVVVDNRGVISIPFVGEIKAVGKTTQSLQAEMVRRLQGKANQPQALVGINESTAQAVTVMGEVEKSMRLPLTAKRERLLDALATAGGGKGRIDKLTVVFTRSGKTLNVPLVKLLKDPSQNISLQSGDVISVVNVTGKITVLGALGKNSQVEFGADGLNLLQALAESNGLLDNRANPKGVFVFRQQKSEQDPMEYQPTVYRFDFSKPQQFFYAKDFAIQDGDILYVANSASTGLSKFLQLLTNSLTSVRIIQGL